MADNTAAQSAPTPTYPTKIHWILLADQAPGERDIVIVHGGIALYRGGSFYTALSEPIYARQINWSVTHWAHLRDLTPPVAQAVPNA